MWLCKRYTSTQCVSSGSFAYKGPELFIYMLSVEKVNSYTCGVLEQRQNLFSLTDTIICFHRVIEFLKVVTGNVSFP